MVIINSEKTLHKSCLDLPLTHSKVTLLEDGEGHIHLKNLSLHSASNEEEGKLIL